MLNILGCSSNPLDALCRSGRTGDFYSRERAARTVFPAEASSPVQRFLLPRERKTAHTARLYCKALHQLKKWIHSFRTSKQIQLADERKPRQRCSNTRSHFLPTPPPRCLVSVLKHNNISLRSHSNPSLICEEYIVSYILYLSTFEHFRSCFISH